MFTDEEILEAARTIRFSLPALLDVETAQACDQQLSVLLNSGDEVGAIAPQILDILKAHDTTKGWLINFLKEVQKSSSSLPGNISLTTAQKYVCPIGNDSVWDREDIGQPIPLCPTHLVPLVPAKYL